MEHLRCVVWVACVGACSQGTVNGSGLLLNVQPAPPTFKSTYDFDLLKPVAGKACVHRFRSSDSPSFWVSIPGFVPTSDAATNQAIGAAAFQAVSKVESADTLLMMRIVTRGEAAVICATVYGRAVKVRKSGLGASDLESPENPADADSRIPTLDRDLIASTVQSVMSEIRQCATFDHGLVKLAMVVAPNGMVSSVTIVSAPKGDLGECVATEIKKVVFPPSKSGATFTYPFNL